MTNNKVIAIFEDNKFIQIERYEDNLKVGSRKMLPPEYFASMASNLTPGALMSILVNHRDFESSLSSLQDEGDFEEFLTTILANVPNHFLNAANEGKLHPMLVNIVRAVTDNIWSFKDIDTKTLNSMIIKLARDSRIDFDSALFDLTNNLVSQLLRTPIEDEAGRDARMSIFKYMYRSLTAQQQKVEKDLLYSIIAGFSASDYADFVYKTRDMFNEREVAEFDGVIPKDCSYMFKTNKRTVYGFELKKARYRIKFHNQIIGEIGHPRLAFFYTVDSTGRVNSMRVYAMKDDGKRFSGDSELYQYPYSNVYGSGEVCWGGKHDFTFDDMNFAASGFLMANNTGHLTDGAMDFLKAFRDSDFDDENLIFKGKVKDTL